MCKIIKKIHTKIKVKNILILYYTFFTLLDITCEMIDNLHISRFEEVKIMNPYDNAHELVRALKNCKEVKEYLELKEELYKDEKNKEMIKDIRDKQMEIQNLLMQGKEAEQEKIEKLQSLYAILASNVKIKEFFDKEIALDVMLSDIYKIIGEALKEIME